MRISSLIGAAALSALTYAASFDDIPDIKAFGQHFFYTNNGSQFFMKGIAYQEDFNPSAPSANRNLQYIDPLADKTKCARDIPVMKQLFTNVVRVYALDPTANHDDCMEMLASNDIYVVADLGEPTISIDSNNPSWNVPLFQRYASVIDTMQKYKNVIGFFVGNEVIEMANQTVAAAYVKAAVRDTKAYIKSQGYRDTLGIGYATADVPSRDTLALYLACQSEDGSDSSIDFSGYNIYSWCGFSNYQESSYDQHVDFYRDYPVPVFFAEYGCNVGIPGGPTHRPFTEVEVLFGNMTEVFSGGTVYRWFPAVNNYGLIQTDGDKITPEPDFTSLMSELAKVTPSSTASSTYTPTNTPPACPTADNTWAPAASPLPPPANPELCDCIMSSLTCTIQSNDAESYDAGFGFICGEQNGKFCAGIQHDPSTGQFGAVSGCSPKQQLAFVANQYYLAQDEADRGNACNFNGLAATQQPQTAPTCSSLLKAAGAEGTGSVPEPTGSVGSPSGSGALSSSSSAAAPNGLSSPSFHFGQTYFVAYVITAIVCGVGMIML
ncbi:Glucanosyltransferase-domain-containing protein [Xylaria nigripes]|nr:Glucanosyltransferase-domain-containing protein [Xylaria nigripes]